MKSRRPLGWLNLPEFRCCSGYWSGCRSKGDACLMKSSMPALDWLICFLRSIQGVAARMHIEFKPKMRELCDLARFGEGRSDSHLQLWRLLFRKTHQMDKLHTHNESNGSPISSTRSAGM